MHHSHAHRYSVFSGMPPLRAISLLALMGFVLFIAFRIFTPPVKTVQVLAAPDGSREARLQHVYYYSDPGFKIAVRETPPGKSPFFNPWHTLFYLSEYTNAPAGKRTERMRWSAGSSRLYFEVNGTAIWSCDFVNQSSKLRSP